MNIFIGSDHAGYELKEYLRNILAELGHRVIDYGSHEYHELDDYPYIMAKVARAVSEAEELQIVEEGVPSFEAIPHEISTQKRETKGIVIGGSGQGEAMVANKYNHIRAALCYGGESGQEIVKLSREHNDSNILSLGARFISKDEALELVLLWLNTPFSGDKRHVRRLGQIENLEHNTLYE